MKRFSFILVTLLIVSGLLLAACAAPGAPAPSPSPSGSPVTERPAPLPAPTGGMTAAEQQLYEAAKKEGELIIWSNTWRHDTIEHLFSDRYPGIKVSVWDGPQGTALVAQFLEEAKAGKTSLDLFFGSTADLLPALDKGVLKPYNWPNAVGMAPPPQHLLYFTHTATARAPAYNTKMVSPAEAPKKWEDLMSPRWKGKAIMSTSGETSTLMFAYLWREGNTLAWDKATKFWKDARAATNASVARGFSTTLELLAAGEYDIFLLSSLGVTFPLIWKGAPIAIAPVGKVGAVSWSAAIMKNAPHPAATQLFADFFSRPESMAYYADAFAETSLSSVAQKMQKIGKEYQRVGVEVEPVPAEHDTEANNAKSVDLWREITALRR
ncbi:MAG: extracellular solute-binding protein [Dehalococcoidia bacterium]|nr:extracellular solute-binding protein [Dehalococcoidia bacterium]